VVRVEAALRPAFSVVEPPQGTTETPVIVEVPHAGLSIDAQSLATLVAPARSIGRDADLWVDDLYADAPAHGATLIVAHVSRYVVDLNRGETDIDGDVVQGAGAYVRATRGIVWRLTSEGLPVLEAPLPARELERRLDEVYRPYHRALAQLIERKRSRFGHAVIIAGHSMPSVDRLTADPPRETRETGPPIHRADVVPGTRGRTSAAAPFIDAVDAQARLAGFSVAHDDPYAGGFTTTNYGRPAEGVHVVQVELARRLYMDEATLQKHMGFSRVKSFCMALVGRMGAGRPPSRFFGPP
jgi:N-formylglutamate amidohydrolase